MNEQYSWTGKSGDWTVDSGLPKRRAIIYGDGTQSQYRTSRWLVGHVGEMVLSHQEEGPYRWRAHAGTTLKKDVVWREREKVTLVQVGVAAVTSVTT